MAKRKRRNFTPEFKATVVLEALSGESSQAELCRRYNLSEDQLSKWKQQLLENAASVFESRDKTSEAAYEDITDASARIGHFITHVYHHKRPHSALGNHLTPIEFERKNLS